MAFPRLIVNSLNQRSEWRGPPKGVRESPGSHLPTSTDTFSINLQSTNGYSCQTPGFVVHSACFFIVTVFMPTTHAAAKAHRQNVKARARNKVVTDNLKKLQVRLRKALTAKDQAMVVTVVKEFTRALDKAAQKKVVGRNTAARKKSRLAAILRRP